MINDNDDKAAFWRIISYVCLQFFMCVCVCDIQAMVNLRMIPRRMPKVMIPKMIQTTTK